MSRGRKRERNSDNRERLLDAGTRQRKLQDMRDNRRMSKDRKTDVDNETETQSDKARQNTTEKERKTKA